ncbi:hypothetical protein [Ruegeria sp.]|uniref:hypothetical protein n=1 Tax=Ruegeria sp. TaxID=1879320 RepID=UPI003C79D20B
MTLEFGVTEANVSGAEYVDADLYVLAAGTWPETGAARLTLQVEPAPIPKGTLRDSTAELMTLESWPSGIAAKLAKGVRLTFVRLNPGSANLTYTAP